MQRAQPQGVAEGDRLCSEVDPLSEPASERPAN